MAICVRDSFVNPSGLYRLSLQRTALSVLTARIASGIGFVLESTGFLDNTRIVLCAEKRHQSIVVFLLGGLILGIASHIVHIVGILA